jgi:hypothetical protein
MTFSESPLEARLAKAQKIVLSLQALGKTPVEISKGLENRISARTLYRWAKGEHAPQRKSDLEALEELAKKWAT